MRLAAENGLKLLMLMAIIRVLEAITVVLAFLVLGKRLYDRNYVIDYQDPKLWLIPTAITISAVEIRAEMQRRSDWQNRLQNRKKVSSEAAAVAKFVTRKPSQIKVPQKKATMPDIVANGADLSLIDMVNALSSPLPLPSATTVSQLSTPQSVVSVPDTKIDPPPTATELAALPAVTVTKKRKGCRRLGC
jgi:hypothetical protein